MRYGILTYERHPMKVNRVNKLNAGDPIQTYAMKQIYEMMGIGEENLIAVSRYESKYYDGEYVVLPFNCFNRIYNQLGMEYGTFPLSPKIIPIFISFHLHSCAIPEDMLMQLRAHQPIGCRDEETMINLRKHGILSYHSGCVTALLPKRKQTPSKQKVFFVDIPETLRPFIPSELWNNSEEVEHFTEFNRSSNEFYMTEEEYENYDRNSVNRLLQYRDEATLVVTSRLHAATPCIAMGIPVILVSNNFDGRFSGIDRYVPLYTPEDFDKIDWNPVPVEYEETKKVIQQLFISQIHKKYNDAKEMYQVSEFYESRQKNVYNHSVKAQLSTIFAEETKLIRFAVWGLITQAETLKNIIIDQHPQWIYEVAIDKLVTGTFEGRPVISINEIEQLDDEVVVFVLPEVAHESARELFERLKRRVVLVRWPNMELFDYRIEGEKIYESNGIIAE